MYNIPSVTCHVTETGITCGLGGLLATDTGLFFVAISFAGVASIRAKQACDVYGTCWAMRIKTPGYLLNLFNLSGNHWFIQDKNLTVANYKPYSKCVRNKQTKVIG